MILSFKTAINGRPTYFVQKILACVVPIHAEAHYPKKHTIRKGERWRAGMKIHMATGVRTKKYNQFNEGIEALQRVVSVQKIEIKYLNSNSDFPFVFIDGRKLSIFNSDDIPTFERLALSDGFESVSKFLEWFDADFDGQIIHWTNERY